MKIEMGESLFYSWLRHVKECQIVQTNWKVSPQWTLCHEDELEEIRRKTDEYFAKNYGYSIYKKNASLSQIIQQGECDALGISIQDGENKVYAVDVAFHERGLDYGSRGTTVMKVINKCLRTAMCIYGFIGSKDADIYFASPKINPGILQDALPCIEDAQRLMDELGYRFHFRIIANNDFRDTVLNPILLVSGGVADTNELFLRSYQMLSMFDDGKNVKKNERSSDEGSVDVSPNTANIINLKNAETLAELKIGRLAQTSLRILLEEGRVSDEEVMKMQDAEYSKEVFDLAYPVLVRQDSDYNRVRYYCNPVTVNGVQYMICSQWFEVPANNDRPYLLRWIEEHT